MSDIRKLARIQIVIVVLFIFFKAIRGFVLEQNFPETVDILFLSLPNFWEAVVGILVLTGIGLLINQRWLGPSIRLGEKYIYILAVFLAGVYVILQEFKIHNLGGNNVYDPYDVAFSIVGLLAGYGIVLLVQPKVHPESGI